MLRSIDHVVMTVRDIDATAAFYGDVLGAKVVRFGEARTALQIGNQKINLHEYGREVAPHARVPTAGSLDICFRTDLSSEEIEERLDRRGIEVELGPVMRTGAIGAIESIYIRDPDGNLIEIARQCEP